MVMETIQYASSKKSLEIPEIPNLPKNIAAIPKPDKQEIINNQISTITHKISETNSSFHVK